MKVIKVLLYCLFLHYHTLSQHCHLYHCLEIILFISTTPLTPLIPLFHAIQRVNALDSFTEVLICLKDENLSTERIQSCLELYLEEEELQNLGEDWKTEESHTELNQKLQKYFSSSQIEILLNGRSIVLSTLTPSIVKALLDMDQILSTPIHSLLPT